MTSLMEPRHREEPTVSSPRATTDPTPRKEKKRGAVPLWRRIVPALAISVIVMAGIYATVPFTFAGAVECRQHGLSGATPAPGTPAGTVIGDINKRCEEAGNSRIAMAGVTAVLAAVVGVAGAFAPATREVNARRALAAESDGAPSDKRHPAGSRSSRTAATT